MSIVLIAASVALLSAPASDQAERAPTGKSGKATKYCLTYEGVVGSRVTKTECKTKAQWADRGIDVDDLKKGN